MKQTHVFFNRTIRMPCIDDACPTTHFDILMHFKLTFSFQGRTQMHEAYFVSKTNRTYPKFQVKTTKSGSDAGYVRCGRQVPSLPPSPPTFPPLILLSLSLLPVECILQLPDRELAHALGQNHLPTLTEHYSTLHPSSLEHGQ